MGCQCTKANEKCNMDLEHAPPKVQALQVSLEEQHQKPEKEEQHEKPEKVEHVVIEDGQSKINNTVNESKDQSSIQKKKVVKKKKVDPKKLVNVMLEAINGVRTKPVEYSKKIIELTNFIKEEDGKLIFDKGTRVGLNRGVEHFQAIAEKVSERPVTSSLQLKEELCVPIPENFDLKDKKWQEGILKSLKIDNEDKYSFYAVNLDVGSDDPETSLLLQVVDDNKIFNGKRRDNILNSNFNFVGITFAKQKAKSIWLIIFAQ